MNSLKITEFDLEYTISTGNFMTEPVEKLVDTVNNFLNKVRNYRFLSKNIVFIIVKNQTFYYKMTGNNEIFPVKLLD